MSLSREELLQLMAYVDGEVEEGEIPEVLALLAKSDPGRRFVEQHSAVGEWVRASGEAHAVAARADDIVGAVMVRVAELGSAPGLAPVIVLEHGRAKTVRSRERGMAFAVLGAVAAMVSLVYAWPRNRAPMGAIAAPQAPASPNGSSVAIPRTTASGEPPAPAEIAAAEPEGQGVDVQAVESPNHPVSIFYVPAAGANSHASSVVVWIGEK